MRSCSTRRSGGASGSARSWGFGSLEVTNLFAWATDPTLLVARDEPVGDGNDRSILDAARAADRVVVAWGVRGSHRRRGDEVADLLADLGVRPLALRVTGAGIPPIRSTSGGTRFPSRGAVADEEPRRHQLPPG